MFGAEILNYLKALVYVGTVSNEAFIGPAPMVNMAEQIVRCRGPSGQNVEYLIELWLALKREWQAIQHWFGDNLPISFEHPNDAHLDLLVEAVMQRLPSDSPFRQQISIASNSPPPWGTEER